MRLVGFTEAPEAENPITGKGRIEPEDRDQREEDNRQDDGEKERGSRNHRRGPEADPAPASMRVSALGGEEGDGSADEGDSSGRDVGSQDSAQVEGQWGCIDPPERCRPGPLRVGYENGR